MFGRLNLIKGNLNSEMYIDKPLDLRDLKKGISNDPGIQVYIFIYIFFISTIVSPLEN